MSSSVAVIAALLLSRVVLFAGIVPVRRLQMADGGRWAAETGGAEDGAATPQQPRLNTRVVVLVGCAPLAHVRDEWKAREAWKTVTLRECGES